MKIIDSSPKKDGFRMPGEFEPHAGCWMIWPERPDNWRLGAKPAQDAFVEVAKAIAQFEPVTMCVCAKQYDNALHLLSPDIRVVEMSNDDSWVRDCGPTFVTNDKGVVRGVDWDFNAWGGLLDGLYFPWDQDDKVARKICEIEHKDVYRTPGFILEGGSIHSDGEGTVFTTEECLLSEGRNPHLSKAEIEDMLKEYLGAGKIIWLKRGIYNDETNGHVDNIMCVVKPGVVMLAWTEDKNDPQYDICVESLRILENETDFKGRKLEVIKLMLPKPVLITAEESGGVDSIEGTLPRMEGDRLSASYVNFYIANGGIVFPLLGDPNDTLAGDVLKKTFPDRKIVGVPAREILLGGGNIHCITQQQPNG
jgi:agmatine deiminase